MNCRIFLFLVLLLCVGLFLSDQDDKNKMEEIKIMLSNYCNKG